MEVASEEEPVSCKNSFNIYISQLPEGVPSPANFRTPLRAQLRGLFSVLKSWCEIVFVFFGIEIVYFFAFLLAMAF